MASRYYGCEVGAGLPADITESGSTTSKKIELVVDLTASGLNKIAVLKALKALEGYIIQDATIG